MFKTIWINWPFPFCCINVSGYGFADVLFRGVYSGIFIKSYEGTDFSSIVLDDDLEVVVAGILQLYFSPFILSCTPEGIAFYSAMLDEVDKYNIEPVATLYAYDLPLNLLEKYRGFMSHSNCCAFVELPHLKSFLNPFSSKNINFPPFYFLC